MLEMARWAGKNILRKRAQNMLTILGITIGVFSVLIISAIGATGRIAINSELESLGFDCITISPVRKDLNRLDTDALSLVSNIDGVEIAAPLMTGMGQVIMREYIGQVMVCGVDHNAQSIITMPLQNGRFFRSGDISYGANICVVDKKLAMEYYKRTNIVGKKLEITIGGETEEFEIVGVVTSDDSALRGMVGDLMPSFVYIPYTIYQRLTHKSTIDQMFVRVSSMTRSENVGSSIVSALDREAGYQNLYRYEDLAIQKNRLNNILEVITLILSAIGAISLIVSGLSIMTIMIVSVQERTREIGIKKAIGAKSRAIMAEFMIETLVMTSLGSGCGILASVMTTAIAGVCIGMPLWIEPRTIVYTILFSGLVGVIFGVYPAKLAAGLKPVDALRYE